MNSKFLNKLISFITVFFLCFNSIALAAKPVEEKTPYVKNKKPTTDLKVATKKSLDLIVATDYRGQKLADLKSELNNFKGNLFNKNVDVQYNVLDESTKVVTDIYDNTFETTSTGYCGSSYANLTHNGKIHTRSVSINHVNDGAYPTKVVGGWNYIIEGDNILEDTPSGTYKVMGFPRCIIALTKDGYLYYTGTLNFCGVGNVVTVPYTGFKLAMTGVKDFIPGNDTLCVLKNDGTVYYSGFIGRNSAQNIVSDCVSAPFAPELIYTNGLQKIEGLRNITRIFAGSVPSSSEGGSYSLASIVAINDVTGDVFAVGWNKGEFGYHTPEYYKDIGNWLYRYCHGYTYPIEKLLIEITNIDGRRVKDWQFIRNEYVDYSLILMKDGSYYKLAGNGFHLIYSGDLFWSDRSVNPYGTYEQIYGNTDCKVGHINPGSFTKLATLPRKVLKILYRGTDYAGNKQYIIYCDDLKYYEFNLSKDFTEAQIAKKLASGNYGTGVSFAPESYGSYPDPAPLINPIYSLNTDSIKNSKIRYNADIIFLYISDNENNNYIHQGGIKTETDINSVIANTENFDNNHSLGYQSMNSTIVKSSYDASNCIYAKATESAKGSLTIDVTVPINAHEPKINFKIKNSDCTISHTVYYSANTPLASANNIAQSLDFTTQTINLTPGYRNVINIETKYTSGRRGRYDDDFEQPVAGWYYIDDITYSCTTTNNSTTGFGNYFPLMNLDATLKDYFINNDIKSYIVTPEQALNFLDNKYGQQKITLNQLINTTENKMYGTGQYIQALKDIENLYTNEAAKSIKVIYGEETVDYKKVFDDVENDPEIRQRWKYEHNPDIYENSLGIADFNEKWLDNPMIDLPYVGRYVVTYQGKDGPTNKKDFEEYNLWSTDEKQAIIDVHRRPIAEFFYTLPSSGSWDRSVNAIDNFDTTRNFSCTSNNISIVPGGITGSAAYGKSQSDSNLATITTTLVVPKGVTDALLKFKTKGSHSGYVINNECDDVISSAKFNNSNAYSNYVIPIKEGQYTLKFYADYSEGSGKPRPRPGDDDDYEPTMQGEFYIDDLQFSYTNIVPYKTLAFTDASFDYDHESLDNKGIVDWEWKYKDTNDSTWTAGYPNHVNKGQKLYVSLRVKDLEGAWSKPCTKLIDGMAPNIIINPLSAGWTNKNVNVSIISKDNSDKGLEVMGYTVLNNTSYPKAWSDKLLNGVSLDTTHTVLQNEGKWYVHAYAKDYNGGQAYKYTGVYLIDKTPPIININSESGLVPKDFVLKLNTTDALSGVADVWCKWSNSKTKIDNLNGFSRLPYVINNNIAAPSADGTYYLHVKCQDKATNLSYKIYGPYKVEKLTVAASVAPNPAKQGQKVIFKVDTTGYAKYLTLYFPIEISCLDSSVPITAQIPEKASHTEYIPYYVPIKTPMTIDRNGRRLRPPYVITVKATKADGTFKTTTVNLDVKGSILDGIKTEIQNN